MARHVGVALKVHDSVPVTIESVRVPPTGCVPFIPTVNGAGETLTDPSSHVSRGSPAAPSMSGSTGRESWGLRTASTLILT
jgi:hypothetical protein